MNRHGGLSGVGCHTRGAGQRRPCPFRSEIEQALEGSAAMRAARHVAARVGCAMSGTTLIARA